jgi:Cu2+-containing amine oxidase
VQASAFQNYYRNNFGYPLMFNISGTLHTHVLAWKVDLDIAGTSNSVNIHHMKVRQLAHQVDCVTTGLTTCLTLRLTTA